MSNVQKCMMYFDTEIDLILDEYGWDGVDEIIELIKSGLEKDGTVFKLLEYDNDYRSWCFCLSYENRKYDSYYLNHLGCKLHYTPKYWKAYKKAKRILEDPELNKKCNLITKIIHDWKKLNN